MIICFAFLRLAVTIDRMASSTMRIGCCGLIACSMATAACAVWVEAFIEKEPALRGLVHAGVMVLFAWICIEGHAIGLIFAGSGLLLMALLPPCLSCYYSFGEGLAGRAKTFVLSFLLFSLGVGVLLPVLRRMQPAAETDIVGSLCLFILGSCLSLRETWRNSACQERLHWTMFFLDAMANVSSGRSLACCFGKLATLIDAHGCV